MSGEFVLLLGGARSGKSAAAEQLAQAGRRVLFIAHGGGAGRRHAPPHRRPPRTAAERVGHPGRSRYDTVVLDCLTLWVSNLLLRHEDDPGVEDLILDTASGLRT